MSIGKSGRDRLFSLLNSGLLVLGIAAVLYPLWFILIASFSDSTAVAGGAVRLFPVKPTLAGYEAVFSYPDIWTGYKNTILYATFGTAVNVVMTIAAGYPLSRKDMRGRRFLMFALTFTMLFSGGMIPTYILVSRLGLMDTPLAMIIPSALSVWNVIITRTYYQTAIPESLLEASKLDGCSDVRFIVAVVLPLSRAITAVNALFYAVGHWNAFFDAFLYLQNRALQPLQVILRDILLLNTFDPTFSFDYDPHGERELMRELLKYALIIVATAPVLMFYPFVQKYFVKGVMIGSLKG